MILFTYLIPKIKRFLLFVDTDSGFKSFSFVRHSYTVPALSISLIDSSTNSEILNAEELLMNSGFEGV